MTVTIIIPIRNEAPYIPQLLNNIFQQDYPVDLLEILLIDGQSSDYTREATAKCLTDHSAHYPIAHRSPPLNRDLSYPDFRILQNQLKISSAALNIGIRNAKGDIILRMDAHTDYAQDYISKCVDILKKTRAWNVGGPARTKADGYMQRAIAAAYHSSFSVGGARFHDVDYEGYVDTVTYGCWRKQTLLDIGGFDEELVRNQDDELNLRIIRAGGTIYQSPDIKSWYHPRSSLSALFRQYLQYGYWKVRVIRKHHMPASPRHLIPVLFVLGLVIGPVLGVFSPLLLTAYFGVLASYLLALVTFSIQAARLGGWDILPVLPLTIMTYHLSYGIGFLAGIVDALFRKNSASTSAMFSGLSR